MGSFIRGNSLDVHLTKDSAVKSFSQCSLSEIVAMVNDHYDNKLRLQTSWKVNNSKEISLSAINTQVGDTGATESHVAQDVRLRIIGFDYDELVTPINGHERAAVTFLLDPLLESGYMNASDTSVGGWETSDRRKWCNASNKFLSMLDSTLKNAIKQVKKGSGGGTTDNDLVTTEDYSFLLSAIEYGRYEPGVVQGTLQNINKNYSSFVNMSHPTQNAWVRDAKKNADGTFLYYTSNWAPTYVNASTANKLSIAFCL